MTEKEGVDKGLTVSRNQSRGSLEPHLPMVQALRKVNEEVQSLLQIIDARDRDRNRKKERQKYSKDKGI